MTHYILTGRRLGKSLIMEEATQRILQAGLPVIIATADGTYSKLRMDDPCDEFQHELIRPAEPKGEDTVCYRGWEVGWDQNREFYTGVGYIAYKGGCDLDAPQLTAGSWAGILDAIDEECE